MVRPAHPSSNVATGTPAKAAATSTNGAADADAPTWRHFSCVWCKYSRKKHKSWQGDAVLSVKGSTVILQDLEAKEIGKSSTLRPADLVSLQDGETLNFSGKIIEIMGTIERKRYESGACFRTASVSSATLTARTASAKLLFAVSPILCHARGLRHSLQSVKQLKPRYDPNQPGALVLKPPPVRVHSHLHMAAPSCVPLVVDPHLSTILRPHQREGVRFVIECVAGCKSDLEGTGCILADDMGLGKTLQCISVVWTLLKQGFDGKPLCQRALIICPGSLVKNWEAEFRKWLGVERIKTFAISSANKLEHVQQAKAFPVVIVSYEMYLRCMDLLKQVRFDVVICDEAHRLKNANAKTTRILSGLATRRRIALTGTPVQNDLQEFFTLVDFVNPGLFGSSAKFKRLYETPIVRARQHDATPAEKDLGEARAEELNRTIHEFVLRRTKEVNAAYLPPKTDYVVFCQPTPLQLQLYQRLIATQFVRSCMNAVRGGTRHLLVIAALRMLCNAPSLLAGRQSANVADSDFDRVLKDVRRLLPGSDDNDVAARTTLLEGSGKVALVRHMLRQWREKTDERALLVSNSTRCLDILQLLCEAEGWPFLRLQGSTPTHQRLEMVNRFNARHHDDFVFLMSSKAGGVGLNIVGASRLVLFDTDWNPSHDLQAMARIWREGQTRPVFIYRLVATGTIEEKIYQRQIVKSALGTTVMEDKETEQAFSTKDLKELFQLHLDVASETVQLMRKKKDKISSSLVNWGVYQPPFPLDDLRDSLTFEGVPENLATCLLEHLNDDNTPPAEPAIDDNADAGCEIDALLAPTSDETEDEMLERALTDM
ncbi:uncharacterized protein MONBRDRAFT_16342 [Monosiga brevicollis MX1]|uniref:DNA repair and recombination protein RAD54B n=1 Tax=Monosiga brevicollis TaxID=81824 RepID=A9UX01_MONBE|nr:uncharacterized protein MONBRDRAFT_16342 [Monosiga brevicollis MX1]EDQ90307.1 predicted protein [Monosiga brevicollis MX1]|eukprot:XP_001745074.1 hypothetical protein [Monosiga brevicollis MX1]